MSTITLTADQENAYHKFVAFIQDPLEHVFVLSGYAGTGKSTLVNKLLDELPSILRVVRIINPGAKSNYTVHLTATTNKAAEALSAITKEPVVTIQSFLGLTLKKDYNTGEAQMIIGKAAKPCENGIIFIDEASYIDSSLLKQIFTLTKGCKLVFIGDPAQLTPVKSADTPVFNKNWKGAQLDKVVRQAEGSPIMELATAFRNTVNTGQFFSFTPDGTHIQHLSQEVFDQAIISEFTRPDWSYGDSKILAWTNQRVISYNHGLRTFIQGTPHFQEGDYAICNQFMSNGGMRIRTDEMVRISHIDVCYENPIPGWWVKLNGADVSFFLPKNFEDKKAILKLAREGKPGVPSPEVIEKTWIDLRAAYACTINKSQGSTYDKVFVDLNDIGRCNNGNQIARMLYVAVSRARYHVYFTGDLV
jgi:hypothetical protein